jgi:lipopolysaccharide transport system permease protein
VIVVFVDFLITFAMLALLMAWYRFLPGWRMLVLPGFVVLALVASMGPCLMDHRTQREVP